MNIVKGLKVRTLLIVAQQAQAALQSLVSQQVPFCWLTTFRFNHGLQESFFSVGTADNEIDGLAFLDLTIEDLNKLLPDKLGIVKKIYRLVQAVSQHNISGYVLDSTV